VAPAEPSSSSAWLGLIIGAAIAVTGIAIAYRIWIVDPAIATRLRERSSRSTRSCGTSGTSTS